jgi:UDP-N-acetylmuramyl pentapeptide phosphotransferase/UDP-N-acetylglucosamine-1-phosphate transferase
MALLLASFLLGLGGAVLARRHALRRNLLDQPGERRSHTVPTPRGGGIGIVTAWILAWAWVGARTATPPGTVAAAIGGMCLVAGVGWIDDHRPLSARIRLVAHVVAGAGVAAALSAAGAPLLVALIALVAVAVLVNVWNFMDGIDGIAASQAVLVALAWAWLAGPGPAMVVALALAAGCCGFLPMNLPKARIFLGDVGSGALGFALAVLLVLLAGAPGVEPLHWLVLVLPLSAFLIDASLTLARRMLLGHRWWTPHVTHAYQQLAAWQGRHWPVTLAYAAWTVAMCAVALLVPPGEAPITIGAFIGCCGAGALAWWAATGRAHRIGRDVVDE